MHIPNLITIARIFLVPLTVWLIISEAYGWAFASFMVAGLSDGIDGFLARRFNWRTELGAYLDPLADKALMTSVYVTLGVLKVLPAWLVIIVVSRDVLIVAAILLSRLVHNPVRVAPLMLSKVNTAAQIAFIIVVLGVAALAHPLGPVVNYGSIPVALLTVASGAAYLKAWLEHMNDGTTNRPPGSAQ
jgi:cardiolipin synthase (CMP-forming)